jgi:hypothetical protein
MTERSAAACDATGIGKTCWERKPFDASGHGESRDIFTSDRCIGTSTYSANFCKLTAQTKGGHFHK